MSSNLHVKDSTFNSPGRDQITINQSTVVNHYDVHTAQAPGQGNANQPEPPRRINDAPVDRLSVHFTGRQKDLDFLTKALNNRRGDLPSRCAIYGMPGIGKTQLLLQYAKISFDQRQYSHIFWTSATSVDKLCQGFSNILDLVDHRSGYLQDHSAKLTSARLWLEGWHGGGDIDWLLILDNVHRDVLDFLYTYLPRRSQRGDILFTTRTVGVAEALVKAAGEQYPTLELKALDLQETAKLLVEDAGLDSETETLNQAEKLVKCVGLLPLAVIHAGSYMKKTGTTINGMLELYNNKHKIEVIQWENNLTPYEELSVAATFNNQFGQLNQESYDISNLLNVLSFLDPENIPLEMITKGAAALPYLLEEPLPLTSAFSTSSSASPPPPLSPRSLPKPTFLQKLKQKSLQRGSKVRRTKSQPDILPPSPISSELHSLVSLILSPIQFQKAVQKLHDLSLVEHRSHIGGSSLWIHDLIQFMAQESAKTKETHQEWLQLSILLVYHAFQHIEDPQSPRSWAECEQFIPHFRSLNRAWNEAYGMSVELCEAMTKIGIYLESRGRLDEAEKLCKQPLEVREKLLGPDHLDTLDSVNALAHVYWSQGRYAEAELLYERALAGRTKYLGTKHPDTLMSAFGLAVVYQWKGLYNAAEKLHKVVLTSREGDLGVGHPDILESMKELGHLYWWEGRYEEAEALHSEVLANRQQYLGPDHLTTLKSLNNLGLVYWSQGRYKEAEALHEKALATRKDDLGSDHPDTLVSMGNLARLYCSQGRYDEAKSLHQQVLTTREKYLGLDHPRTLHSVDNLSLVWWGKGRYDEAERLQKRALAGRERHLVADHPDTLESINNLGLVYLSQNRYNEAAELLKRAVAGRTERLGAGHPATLDSMHNLACVYQAQGRYDTASALYTETLAGQKNRLGGGHPDTLKTAENLANLHQLQARYYDADTDKEAIVNDRLEIDR